MPTRRGWAAFVAGVSLWIAARLLGSPDLHMVAAGLVALPLLAMAFVRWSRVRLAIRRHLSSARVFAGSRVVVDVTLENLGRSTTSFLLLEDALPPAMGRPARLVVSGIPPRNKETVSYGIVCRQRGRYVVGPLSIFVSDPFGLARTTMQTTGTTDLLVFPEVESLEARHLVSQGVGAGESTVRHLHRSAAEFYTMREYVTGDDLRRIHWPSVARTGQLMIRQDEATRRSSATVFFDNRVEVLGTHASPGFERGASVAASLGRAFIRAGFTVRLATADAASRPVSEELLLEALAGVSPSKVRGTADVLRGLRAGAMADTTLAMVTAPPSGGDASTMIRAGLAFGRKVAVLIHPVALASLSPDRREELLNRASSATASLRRAGWDVFVLAPEGRLADLWHRQRTRKLTPVGSSS